MSMTSKMALSTLVVAVLLASAGIVAVGSLHACGGPIDVTDLPIPPGPEVGTTSQGALCTICRRPTWIAPTLSPWWTGEGVGYSKDPFGFVRLTGTVTSGEAGSAGETNLVFTLPAGFRPPYQTYRYWRDPNETDHAWVVVKTSGEVWVLCSRVPGSADLGVIEFYAQ